MGMKHYKHNFMFCHLRLSQPEEIPVVTIILTKSKDEAWGDYSTNDENIQALIEKTSYFKNKSGLRIFEVSQKEAEKVKGKKPKNPKYKAGVLSGVK